MSWKCIIILDNFNLAHLFQFELNNVALNAVWIEYSSNIADNYSSHSHHCNHFFNPISIMQFACASPHALASPNRLECMIFTVILAHFVTWPQASMWKSTPCVRNSPRRRGPCSLNGVHRITLTVAHLWWLRFPKATIGKIPTIYMDAICRVRISNWRPDGVYRKSLAAISRCADAGPFVIYRGACGYRSVLPRFFVLLWKT